MNEREALKLALEALGHFEKAGLATLKTIDAITAIKQALAQEKALQALHNENERLGLYKDAYGQPEPKPFGYFRYDLRLDAWVQNRAGLTGTPFYTSPPKREPLTDEEIYLATNQIDRNERGWAMKFARAVEAAHGITGEQHGTR